jgi:hypothetical protein
VPLHPRSALLTGDAFVATSALGLLVTLLTVGSGSPGQWLKSLGGFSQDIAGQPGIASLSGVYVGIVSSPVRAALEVITIGAALAVTIWWWRKKLPVDGPQGAAVWLWPLWLLAVPYAHYPDEMILAVPVVAMLGIDGAWLGRRAPAFILYLLGFSLWLTPWSIHGVQTAPLVPLLFASCLAASTGLPGRPGQAIAADPSRALVDAENLPSAATAPDAG